MIRITTITPQYTTNQQTQETTVSYIVDFIITLNGLKLNGSIPWKGSVNLTAIRGKILHELINILKHE